MLLTLPPADIFKVYTELKRVKKSFVSSSPKLRFTSFSELAVTAVTNFNHSVFEVPEWVTVPGTSATHHLCQKTDTEKTYTNCCET